MPAKAKSVLNPKKYTLGKNVKDLFDVKLPSGDTCQARRPGVQGLIDAGLLDSFDELTSLVKTEHIDQHNPRAIAEREKVTADDIKAATEAMTQEKLGTVLELVDRLTAYVVVQPAVWIDYPLKSEVVNGEPTDAWTDRNEAWHKAKQAYDAAEASGEEHDVPEPPLAVRLIDLEDKMWLLEWAVGGTSELTSFRKERE